MYNSNGPGRGFNTTSDQSSYDLVSKDIIVCSSNGSPSSGDFTKDSISYAFNLGTDNLNNIYKAELVSAAIAFSNATIPDNVKNNTLIVTIPELSQNTFYVAGNTGGTNYNNQGTASNNQGNNPLPGRIFCQIPDNCTPITPGTLTPNGIISLYIGARMFDTVQYYNPPINKLNQINIQFFDPNGNSVFINSTTINNNYIKTFYFTLRIYYFVKRNNTSALSTPVWNYANSGTIDSIFQPYPHKL